MTDLAVDTSVALPLIVRNHADHDDVSAWWRGKSGSLCGQALIETYSVATRLPAPLQLAADDAARLIDERFARPLALSTATTRRLPALLAEKHIAGGAVYDAVVALTAIEHGRILVTRDRRARGVYETVGVQVLMVGA